MKHLYLHLLAAVAFLGITGAQAEDPAGAPAPAPAPELRLRSLPIDAQELLKSLKVGMTRKQIAQDFEADGGVISPSSERYYLRGVAIPGAPGRVVMIEFTFQPSAMDDATFADAYWRADWYRHHEWGPGTDDSKDIVRSVGKPFAAGVHAD
jgi:hypothetical protein